MKTFLRRLAILEYLRTTKEHLTTEQIALFLSNEGYLNDLAHERTNARSVQRDLKFLLGEVDEEGDADNEFGLDVVKGEGRSLHWKLDPYRGLSYDFEKMPQNMAIAFAMTQKHLSDLLPRNTQQELQRLFSAAEHKLAHSEKALSSKNFSRLKDSIEFYQRGQTLQSADFDMDHMDIIYRAIVNKKQLSFEYRSKRYTVHPLGVAILLPKIYLVAVKSGDQVSTANCRNFLIHKIDSIWAENKNSVVPEDFKLSEYLRQGNMEVYVDRNDDKDVHSLELLIDSNQSRLIEDVTETPISKDQTITMYDSERVVLRARVRRTVQLRTWLLSLGPVCEVKEPSVIRDDLKAFLQSTLGKYS